MSEGRVLRMVVLIDANRAVLGRAATQIAKLLLGGEQVVVVNAEKAIITGDPRYLQERYRHRKEIGQPRKGPFYPSRPDRIFKRAVRGMLPYQQSKGREALKRLRCHIGVPKEYAKAKASKIEGAMTVRTAKYLTLAQIAEAISGRKY